MANLKQKKWQYRTKTTKSVKRGPKSKDVKLYKGQGK
jgi:hypothetical protein